MYPAKNGDAFLVNANGQYVLIDGGDNIINIFKIFFQRIYFAVRHNRSSRNTQIQIDVRIHSQKYML